MQVARVAGKLLGLPRADRGLLLSAALLLVVINLLLWFLPVRRLQAVVVLLTGAFSPPRDDHGAQPERIAWAVTRAAAFVPGATCLVQALAAHALLERRGLPARLRIGVGRTDEGELGGHAWVESGGAVVVGGERSRYTALPLPRDDGR